MTLHLAPPKPRDTVPLNVPVTQMPHIKPLTETAIKMMLLTEVLSDRRPGT